MKRFILCLLALALLCSCAAAEGKGLDMENNNRVFYEIFVASFSDSDGDGTGDLRGIINRMDYLNDGNPEAGTSLGIGGIWLTPVFLSPSYHKYDVTDFYRIDPAFGTLEDLQELIALCHERDVKLILDLPLNHTSVDHRWFTNFKTAHQMNNTRNEYYDYYTWLSKDDPVPGGRRFESPFRSGYLYECNFSESMPELNFDNEKVRQAAVDIAAYWLNLGIDGFRFDAAKYIYYGDNEKSAAFWEWYMEELKKINPHIYTVAEVWDGDAVTDKYLKAFNCFHFSTSQVDGLIAATALGGNVNTLTNYLQNYQKNIRAINPEAMDILFIANHDTDRSAGYLTVASLCAQMAANIYLLSPGSPFLYYGEEIGLRGSRGGANTDANRRLAMLWGDGDTVKDPPGSTYDKQTTYTVKDREASKSSILWYYRNVIALRNANPEIARGTYTALSFPNTKAGGFLCEWNGSVVGVFHNTGISTQKLDLSGVEGLTFSSFTAVSPDFESFSSMDGRVLNIGPQATVIIR